VEGWRVAGLEMFSGVEVKGEAGRIPISHDSDVYTQSAFKLLVPPESLNLALYILLPLEEAAK
jgi:hypothetical protein